MSSKVLTRLADFSMELARDAGATIKYEFNLPKNVETKALDNTPVTDTDKKINQRVIDGITAAFPHDNIFSEEGNRINDQHSHYTWVCDPLDGTKDFIRGIPRAFFSLALTEEGKPIVGVIFDPFGDRMFSAVIGQGTFMNGRRISLSDAGQLDGSGLGLDTWGGMQFDLNPLQGLLKEKRIAVSNGPIVFMGAEVASGNISAFVHPARMPWDSAASKIIIEEEGGKVTDMFGNEQRYDVGIRGCVMSNGRVHEELLSLIRQTV